MSPQRAAKVKKNSLTGNQINEDKLDGIGSKVFGDTRSSPEQLPQGAR